MIKIRRCVFETNSSSTHSISIYKWTPVKESKIPKNKSIEVKGGVPSQTEIKDELGKLKYIICILASLEENIQNRQGEDYIYGVDCCSYKDGYKYFEIMINSNRFKWLKEIIKEKCNTDIKYITTDDCFPYYETVYNDGSSLESILACDINDEQSFKERISEIIFEDNYVIEDKENEY